jgi:hypothetical protein
MPQAAEMIYDGNLNKQFIENVRNGLYPVVEGVVAKGNNFMVKIKTNAYMAKLMEIYAPHGVITGSDEWQGHANRVVSVVVITAAGKDDVRSHTCIGAALGAAIRRCAGLFRS